MSPCVLAACLALVPQLSAARTLQPEGLELAPSGALLRLPSGRCATVDGPEVVLRGEWVEWYGVSFVDVDGLHEGVGAGRGPDWAGREPVVCAPSRSGPGWRETEARLGPLAIETRAWGEGDLVVLSVTLRNLGNRVLTRLLTTREWLVPGQLGWSFPPDLPAREPAPAELARRSWMLDDLEPGASTGVTFALRVGAPRRLLSGPEVPLALWTNDRWPEGLGIGRTNGVSLGDYDGDGWVDLFSFRSGRLLRNLEGTSWALGTSINDIVPLTTNRYGSSFGDYDNDGLLDIGTEPRPGFDEEGCMHLLHGLGASLFEDIATDPALFEGQPCGAPAETICWGDVDDDGDLDVFLPVYPRQLGPGNFFMENLGPTGPGGAWRLRESSAEAGLDNPPGTARPEGAQFVDVDRDGDMDLYSNGTLYRNRSEGSPSFLAMREEGVGIGLRAQLEEGAAFFDYDLDGDQDLFVVYTQRGLRLWEARGDGTFFPGGTIFDEPNIGLDLGLSAEDWDMDGDVDLTTRQVFRRNRLVEDGARHFTVATHAIPDNQLTSATPAWGDWDRDGDLDCALGNWQAIGHFYENTLWDASTPEEQKPYLRVRVERDAPGLPRGLETEYGATVEVVLHGDPHRRQKFVASSHGYLNQNEYGLTFALPPGPDPEVPVAGLVCDVIVDFPGRASRGVLRIDRHVNPALGDIVLAELDDRELTVFRSGLVRRDGLDCPPDTERFGPRLFATGGGLPQPDRDLGLPDPAPAPDGARWVGIELAMEGVRPRLVKELVLDGQLADAPGATFNMALWDVTDPLHPVRVREGLATTSARNRRSWIPFVAELLPAHVYRCVAHVAESRALPPPGPLARHGLVLTGGLDFADGAPLTGKQMVDAPLGHDVALSLRYVIEGERRARDARPADAIGR